MDKITLESFSENLFGVKNQSLTKEDIYKKIAALQEQIVSLTAQLSSLDAVRNHTITPQMMTDLMDRNRCIKEITLNPKSPVSRYENSVIEYERVALAAYHGDYVGKSYYADAVYVTLPLLRYNLIFSHQKINWEAKNGMYYSPTAYIYSNYAPPENGIYVKGGVRLPYDHTNYDKPVAAWSIQCIPPKYMPPEPDDMQTHPHALGVTSPFNSICTGAENRFMEDWKERRFYTASDFKNFITKATEWLTHYNLVDSHHTTTFPEYSGAQYSKLVTDDVFEICLDIVGALSAPIIKALDDEGGLSGKYSIAISEAFEYSAAQRYIDCIQDIKNALGEVGAFLTAKPVRLYNHLESPDGYNSENTYTFTDTIAYVLRSATSDIYDEITQAEDNYQPLFFCNLLLCLRDIAYTAVLMRITADEVLTVEVCGDSVMANTMCTPTFKNMLAYQMAAAVYAFTTTTPSRNVISYCRENITYIDHIRERLAAPKVLYEIHKKNTSETTPLSPEAENILNHLDLPGFRPHYFGKD